MVPRVTRIQHVGAIRTTGLELSAQATGVGGRGLDISGSVTFADSIIRENDHFPASVVRWQPRVPRRRANLLATWRPLDRRSLTGGLRYRPAVQHARQRRRQRRRLYRIGHPPGGGPARALRARRALECRAGRGQPGRPHPPDFHPYGQRTWLAELHYDY